MSKQKQRPYQGYIVNSYNEARPVSAAHRQMYYEIEESLYRLNRPFTEFDLEQNTGIDRKVIRSCLHRLEHLQAIRKTGEYKKSGNRGRPARVWSR